MRNTVVGVVLALVFIAAMFAVGQYGPKSLSGGSPSAPPPPPPPKEAAAKIKASFVGRTKIGDWSLVCTEPRKLPKPPPITGGAPPAPPGMANSAGIKMEVPPSDFRIPRCQTVALLPVPGHPKQAFRVVFRLLGFKRRLAVFIQIPQVADPGEQVDMQLSNGALAIPVRACNEVRQRCLAAQTFKPEEEASKIMRTKSLGFAFQPGKDGKPRVSMGSAYGFTETLATIRRIDT
jgi:hypothetical protein